MTLGFQVRPSGAARRVAEHEEIEIRPHSIIYDAINYVKAAMEGMLAPETEEVIVGNAEVREVFRSQNWNDRLLYGNRWIHQVKQSDSLDS